MIRWLSQLWVSRSLDQGTGPSRLWRYTFGRLASHRQIASQMSQLDGQLKRQAASQQRAIAREHLPIGDYQKHPSHTDRPSAGLPPHTLRWLKPTLTLGSLAAGLGIAVVGLILWANTPTYSPQELYSTATQSFDRVWQPLTRQAESTGQALRQQTIHVTSLPQKLPEMDRVVNDLGHALQSPLREEVQRLTNDLKRPWTYFADQMPRLPHHQTPPQDVSPRQS